MITPEQEVDKVNRFENCLFCRRRDDYDPAICKIVSGVEETLCPPLPKYLPLNQIAKFIEKKLEVRKKQSPKFYYEEE